jgi:hypothetical protein
MSGLHAYFMPETTYAAYADQKAAEISASRAQYARRTMPMTLSQMLAADLLEHGEDFTDIVATPDAWVVYIPRKPKNFFNPAVVATRKRRSDGRSGWEETYAMAARLKDWTIIFKWKCTRREPTLPLKRIR